MDIARFLRVAAVAGMMMAAISAQTPRPTPGGTPANTGPTTTTPSTTTRPPTTSLPSNTSPTVPGDAARPIFLTGKVVLNDGSSPPESVMIQRVCNGNHHTEGYTDSKGHFSIQLGESRNVFADASETPSRSQITQTNPTGGIRESALMNCELRASLPGFRSDVVSLAARRYMDNPDIGTIVLHRLSNVEGLTMSATSALAPKDARKAYEKGLEAAKKNKPDDAQKELEKAVGVYPKYASAWYELGKIYEQRDHVEEARKAYSEALAADSKYINPYERLYLLALKEAKWQDVADTTDRVIHLNPYDFPAAFYYNAIANLQLGKLDAAEKSAREALKLDTGRHNPRTNYVLGLALAQKQDFAGSVECLRTYLKEAPDAKDAERVQKQLADIEKLAQAKAQPQQ